VGSAGQRSPRATALEHDKPSAALRAYYNLADGVLSASDRGPFYLAVTRLEHAERLQAHERSAEAEPLLSEAREIFARLEAAPWLARVERALAAEPVSASS
jgi:hypothetical protein